MDVPDRKAEDTGSNGTFDLDDTLPLHPIIPLHQTLQRYLLSVKPFVTEKEFKRTLSIVQTFEFGVGKRLQERYEFEHYNSRKRAVELVMPSFLHDRHPIMSEDHMLATDLDMQELCPPIPGSQVERASMFVWHILQYYTMLRREQLAVFKNRDGSPFSMDQLRGLFNASRTPGIGVDKGEFYFKTVNEGPCPNHIVVMCNGHIFSMEPFDSSGRLRSVQDMQRQLSYIKKQSRRSKGQCIPLLTSDERDTYARAYRHLQKLSTRNADNLLTIASSIFCLCLEDGSPTNIMELLTLSFQPAVPYNRWQDKSLSWFVFDNGSLAFSGEHSFYDGLTMMILGNYLKQGVAFSQYTPTERSQESRPTSIISGTLTEADTPKELLFDIDTEIQEAMTHAQITHQQFLECGEFCCDYVTHFGTKLMKKYNVHPEVYVVMALQLAYFTMYKKPPLTNQIASRRKFYKGRLDVIRACTTESLAWCEAMLNNSTSLSERLNLFHQAQLKHFKLMQDSANGRGIDRHIKALKKMVDVLKVPMPEFFLDESFKKSGGDSKYTLKCTMAGYNQAISLVDLPAAEDGYRALFAFFEDKILFTITCYKQCPKTNAWNFLSAVSDSLLQMQSMLASSKL